MSCYGRACWLALLAGLAMSCSRTERICKPNETDAAVDSALLAFLSRARSAHHLADGQEQREPDRAATTLKSILDGPKPGSGARLAPEVREVLADTSARIADLESQMGRFADAMSTISHALPWVPDSGYFRGHLYEVLGLVEERQARWFDQLGKLDEASRAKTRAVEAFEESMRIQAEVIRTSSADTEKD